MFLSILGMSHEDDEEDGGARGAAGGAAGGGGADAADGGEEVRGLRTTGRHLSRMIFGVRRLRYLGKLLFIIV